MIFLVQYSLRSLLTCCAGIRPLGGRDGTFCGPDRPNATCHEAKVVQLSRRKSSSSEITIWAEGIGIIRAVQHWLIHKQITFIFILILFIDSVNRVYRVQVEVSSLTQDAG